MRARGSPAAIRAVFMAIYVVLTGCATAIAPPSPELHAELLASKKSIVLLRVHGDDRGRRVAGLANSGPPDGYALRVAEIDTRGIATTAKALAPSAAARDAGWLYVILAPGSYWISLDGPKTVLDDAASSLMSVAPRARGRRGYRWRGEFIYGGSLVFHTPPEQKNALGARWASEWPPGTVTLVDESDAAQRVFHEAFAARGFTDMTTRLMGPYGDPLPNGALNALFPMRLVAVPEAALQGPLLFNRAMQLWMTPAGALIAAGAESGSGYAGAGLVMLGLAYAPLGALGGAIHGAVAEARWKPCDERLRAHLARVRPADALQGRLREVLGTTHANFDPRPGPQPGQAEGGTRTVLWVEITSTALWPGDAGLVTEVAIRARLWDVAARQWAYDRSFVSSPNVAARLLRPYETPFDAASSGRSVTDYCAADGPESFVREIERAADAALAEMIADLQLQAPR